MADEFRFKFVVMVLVLGLAMLTSSQAKWSRKAGSFGQLEFVNEDQENGITWAILVAGSQGYENYRHQADVCHAYQVLKKGGLKDENIVVFMYDDIAMNDLNPRKGVIINTPQGDDVYAGVPKDYTGDQVTEKNLFAVILGDKTSVTGGTGKVVDSGPNDRIFIYYTDHGGPGSLGMPNGQWVYANDFIDMLKKKHEAGTYKEMVIYVEACESGSIFDGLLPDNLNIYVQTAASPDELSWSAYCPGTNTPPPPEYLTCLGDVYSVSWMEDSETHNLKEETIEQQYTNVKKRTGRISVSNTPTDGSHVMEYGTVDIAQEDVYLFQGFDPASKNFQPNEVQTDTMMGAVHQRNADILFLWQLYNRSDEGSEKREEIYKEIKETMAQRAHLDNNVKMIGEYLFGPGNSSRILTFKRGRGLPVVDNWDCLKSMVQMFETHCGSLTQYGMKHIRALANICNNNIDSSEMEDACQTVCSTKSIPPLSMSSDGGYNVRY